MKLGYNNQEEAWDAGYNAGLHDSCEYMRQTRPWWAPRWLWRKVHQRVFIRAWKHRGEDL